MRRIVVSSRQEGCACDDSRQRPLPAKAVKQLATDAGVASRTLRRAKALLRVQSKRRGFGPKSRFFWVLPTNDEVVQRLREHDLQNLADRLFRGPTDADGSGDFTCGPHVDPEHEEYDPADWWKRNRSDDEDDDGGEHVPSQ